MANLEILKAIHKLERILSHGEFMKLLQKENIKLQDYKNRMRGYDKEDEFIIVLKSLNVVRNLIKVDESVIKMFDLKTTDYIIELNNSKKILLEVKSVSSGKPQVKFGIKYIDGIYQFAKENNAVIIFAVCIYNFWMAFDLEYIVSNGYKITLNDYENSILYKVFGLKAYIFWNGIEIKSIYDINNDSSVIRHRQYGGLISQEFLFRGKKIYKYNNKDNLCYVLCSEEINNRLNNTVVKSNNNITTVIRSFNANENCIVIQETDMILSQIYHSIDDNGEYLRACDEIICNNSKNTQVHYLSLSLIRSMLKTFKNRGFIYHSIADSKIYE